MDLSIIIVSYRTPDHLRRCLESLRRDPSPRSREVLVVDNDSGDESPDVARAFEEAEAAFARGEVPVGAVVARGEEIVARASNRRAEDADPSAVARMLSVTSCGPTR